MTIIDAATVKLTATFTEPSRNDDAAQTVLADLNHSTIYMKVGSGVPASAAVIPATSKAGGGAISTTFLAPAPVGVVSTLDVWVTATDDAGNEGKPSAHVTATIDRIAPQPPVNFTAA